MIRSFLTCCCVLLLLTSCEDRQSSQKNEVEKTSEEKQKKEELQSQPQEEKKKKSSSKRKQRPEGPLIVQKEFIPFMTEYGRNNPEDKVRINTRFGNIDLELFHDTPLHRANFIFLVKHDYFDDTFFHRVAKNFVVQGGNSDTPETNKKRHYIGDYLIPSEFEAGHRHVRGALGAAKYSQQNRTKASSPYEFYIVQSDRGAHHLDNEHTVFGRVIDGMEVVDSIAKVKTDQSDWPLRNIYLDLEIIE